MFHSSLGAGKKEISMNDSQYDLAVSAHHESDNLMKMENILNKDMDKKYRTYYKQVEVESQADFSEIASESIHRLNDDSIEMQFTNTPGILNHKHQHSYTYG